MRGYSSIMSSTDSSTTALSGNGQKVCLENNHHLWEPKISTAIEPLWHMRVLVLKDQEGQGDCPGRYFTFKSKHHLTHAANQLEEAFREKFGIRKCGCDSPDAMGGRVNDGRCQNFTIEYETETASEEWKQFTERLRRLEDEWEHEEVSML